MSDPVFESTIANINKTTDALWHIALQSHQQAYSQRIPGPTLRLEFWQRKFKEAARETLATFLEKL